MRVGHASARAARGRSGRAAALAAKCRNDGAEASCCFLPGSLPQRGAISLMFAASIRAQSIFNASAWTIGVSTQRRLQA
jgi:hypothetical protein